MSGRASRGTTGRWRRLASGVLLGGLVGVASPVKAERNNYYAYTDEQGILHVTNRPDRLSGDWSLFKTLEGSGADERRAGPTVTGGERAPVTVTMTAERVHRFDGVIQSAAQRYQLPESLLRAVIHTESNYYAHAVSRAGAVGLMQLMPKTAKALGVRDAYDPGQNINGGARYLRLLANRYDGDMVLVLAAYNAGAGNVEKYGGVPPFAETRAYVRSVLRRFYAYERQQQLGVGERGPGPARHIAR